MSETSGSLTFLIECTVKVLKLPDITHPDLQYRLNRESIDRLTNAGYISGDMVKELLHQKSRLDKIQDIGLIGKYYEVRDVLFPLDKSGSETFYNRAGDKLYEIHTATIGDKTIDIFEGIKGTLRFLDICGGPGAFSRTVIKLCKTKQVGGSMIIADMG